MDLSSFLAGSSSGGLITPGDYLAALGGIILINLVLSGDNALVIGMAAHRLPAVQRRAAIFGGTAVAMQVGDRYIENLTPEKMGEVIEQLRREAAGQ